MKNLMKYMSGEKLTPKELKEGYYEESEIPLEESASDTYSREVKLDINSYGTTFKGGEIDWIDAPSIRLTYTIDIEAREWGIKGIGLYNIQGPSEVELEVKYYAGESDDSSEAVITVPLNWEEANKEENDSEGVVTVGNEVTIQLANTETGDLFVSEITIPVYSL